MNLIFFFICFFILIIGIWLGFIFSDVSLFKRNSDLKDVVKVLTKQIREDEGLYIAYQANIAMAFQDEVERNKIRINKELLHKISNQAAINFIEMWCKRVED